MSRASQGPSNRGGSTRSRTTTRPGNRTSTGREADRIKATRSGWAAPAAAVTTFWRSGPLPLPVAAVAAGLWAALTGLVLTVVLTLVIWIFAAGESASDTAMRAGADIWLVAHGTPLLVGDGVWTLLPWAWIVFPSAALWAAGRWLAHRAAVAYPKSIAVGAAALAAAYSVIALLAALFGTLSGAAAQPGRAALHAGSLALVVSAMSMTWRAQLGREVLDRAWRLARPCVGALATLAAGAAVVLSSALVFSHESLAESLSQLRPGLFGGLALLLGWIGYLPAALMWALSFGVGTGINVGGSTVTALSPLEDRIEMVGLHLLPTTEQPWWLLAGLIPVAAGVVLTRLAGRARSRRDWVLMRLAALALVLICLDVWWVISVGRIGSGRLEVLGPPPIVIAVLTGAVAGGILLDLAGTWVWRRWGHRRIIDLTDRRRAAQQQQSSEADGEQTPTQADGEQHTEDTDAPDLAVHDEDPGSPPVGPADSST